MHSAILRDLILVLTLAVGVTLLFSRIKVPSVVGLLATGILAGPFAMRVLSNAEAVVDMAEVGVVLLLFSIGLELSLPDLFSMARVAIGAGTIQIVGTAAITTAVVHSLLAYPLGAAIVLGCIVALSSTAVTARLLSESAQIEAPHGRCAMTILVYQDLCVLPMTTLIAVLGTGSPDVGRIALALLKSVLLVSLMVLAIRQVVPRLLMMIVASRSPDLFVLGTLLVSLGTAWLGSLVGLSMPLGAFLAGLVVSSSPYSHHALAQIMPLRTVFNSIFFISVGMMVNLQFVVAHGAELLALATFVVVLKTICTAVGLRLVGHGLLPGIATGLCLAQVGEFSFVLAQMAHAVHILDDTAVQLWTAVAVLTIIATPPLVASAGRIGRWLALRLNAGRGTPAQTAEGHVLIAGYGVNGRNLARVLTAVGVPYQVLELNGISVKKCQDRGEPVHYGDATSPETWELLGISRAAKLVIAISDPAATRRAVTVARELAPTLPIVARTRYVAEVERLYACGADQVVTDEMEASLRLVNLVLSHFKVPQQLRENLIEGIFNRRYGGLGGDEDIAPTTLVGATSRTVVLQPGSAAVGQTLATLDLRRRTGATCLSIQRGPESHANPRHDLVLAAADKLILFGDEQAVTRAEEVLRGCPT